MPRIAWIEDDVEIIGPLVEPLERSGHTILRFHSLVEAKEAIGAIQGCDLILLDMLFPTGQPDASGYQGLELAHYFKDHAPTVPVLVLTVVTNKQMTDAATALPNVVRILKKPVLPSTLEREAELAISRRIGSP